MSEPFGLCVMWNTENAECWIEFIRRIITILSLTGEGPIDIPLRKDGWT
jgi:hypothetical protein